MSGNDIRAEVIEDDETQVGTGTEVVARERRSEVIRALPREEVVASFREYQSLCSDLLDKSDWQGIPGGDHSFVKKSGWRKIATAFDLDVQIVRSSVDRAVDGSPLRAQVIARAIAPSGRYMDGDGYCAADESRFRSAGGRQKLENDLRATATTRAKNRAIADLVGMGDVSAEEEVSGGGYAEPILEGEIVTNTSTPPPEQSTVVTEKQLKLLRGRWISKNITTADGKTDWAPLQQLVRSIAGVDRSEDIPRDRVDDLQEAIAAYGGSTTSEVKGVDDVHF